MGSGDIEEVHIAGYDGRPLLHARSGGSVGGSRWVDGSEVDSTESPDWLPDDDLGASISAARAHGGFPDVQCEISHRRRLLNKRSKRIDSLEAEVMALPGAQHHGGKDLPFWSTLAMAFQTLGVVYGDVGTSPLYVFSDVFSKVPIKSEVDVLGALSLVMYTIALVPFAKYVFIVLKANDHGEGGTFALYSLICRYAKVSMLPNQQRADEDISSYRLKLPTPELERALIVKEYLEKNGIFKNFILILVLMGTSMVIGDGILTPSMSVLSAVSGLQGQVPGINNGQIYLIISIKLTFRLPCCYKIRPVNFKMILLAFSDIVVYASVVILLLLFIIQQFGTGKVGFLFAPILALWFLNLGSVGLYNLIAYDASVLKAINPAYIYWYFKANGIKAWSSLGGCVLCITGAEAMFADLGHFSVKSIQIAFSFVVFPCLLLAYMGQAAYALKHPDSVDRIFYDSVPKTLFWPVFVIATLAAMIASQAMISATFSCIKQSMALGCFPRLKVIHTSKKFMGQIYIPAINWFLMCMCILIVLTFRSTNDIANAYGIAEVGVMMVSTTLVTIVMLLIWQTNIILVLAFPLLFGSVEFIYLSAVLSKILEGGWLPLAFSCFFLSIMYTWNYGSVLKYASEMRGKMPPEFIDDLGPSLGTVRVPGVGLIYNELVQGIPSIFGQLLLTLPAMHSVIVFVCIKYVPVPIVPREERFLFRRVGDRSYRLFRCVARYGYKDGTKEERTLFERSLVESLRAFLRKEAGEIALEAAQGANVFGRVTETSPNSLHISEEGELHAPLLPQHEESEQVPITNPGTLPQISLSLDADISLKEEFDTFNTALENGFTYMLAHGEVRAMKRSLFVKKLVVNYFYAFLRRNCRAGTATLKVPHQNILRVGMTYMV